MPEHARQNLVLVGLMGSGKSSVGQMVSRRLGWRFEDTDAAIERQAGCPITEIFRQWGETGFRQLETAVLHALLGTDRTVLATGGGIVVAPENRPLLKQIGCVLWLDAAPGILLSRVSRNSKRPLLHTADPAQTLLDLRAAREPLYREVADAQIDSSRIAHRAVVDLILQRLDQYYPNRA